MRILLFCNSRMCARRLTAMKKYTVLFLMTAALIFSGCHNTDTASPVPTAVAEGSTAEVVTERTFPASEEYVKLTGRTAEVDGIRWLIHSASKIEFKLKGTHASAVIRSDDSINGEEEHLARVAVYVNGERTLDHIVRQEEETIELFSSEEEKEVEIAIIKLSEAAHSIVGIKEIQVTAASDIAPLPEKDIKIEFIGDSVTCGYGVDDEDPTHDFSTATEDATKTYAYKTAEALNADYSMVAYSGYGIVSGYTADGTKEETMLVPPVYESLGKNNGSADGILDLSRDWDFRDFVPDEIVINLGTNDATYTLHDAAREAEFVSLYVDFLKTVRRDNPDARITASLGVMNDNLYPAVEKAVTQYIAETGDENISSLHFTPQDGSTGYAADGHPTEATHALAAKTLIEHLRHN